MDREDRAAVGRVLDEARDLGFVGPGATDRHIEHARGFARAFAAVRRPEVIRGGPVCSPPTTGGETVPLGSGLGPPPATGGETVPGAETLGATTPGRVLDLGSGGGLPGLVLALEWPESRLTLLDAGARRAELLRRAITTCHLEDRVTVLHSRAEEVGHDPQHRGSYDLVVARSFGPPPVTAECAAPLLRPGGLLVVSEPPGEATARWPAPGLAMLGMVAPWLVRERFGYRVVLQGSVCPERFPRRVGVPAKRPLF